MARNRSEKHPFPEADKQARAFLDAWTRYLSGGSAGPVLERWGQIPASVRDRVQGGKILPWTQRFRTIEDLLKDAPKSK